MAKLTIKDLPVSGKRVFVRVDFNVPMEEKDGQMTASGEEFFLHSVYVHRGLAPANGKLVEFTVSDKEEKGPRRCRKAVDARVIPEILQDRIDVAAEVGYALSPETIAKIRVILAQSNEPIPVAASS